MGRDRIPGATRRSEILRPDIPEVGFHDLVAVELETDGALGLGLAGMLESEDVFAVQPDGGGAALHRGLEAVPVGLLEQLVGALGVLGVALAGDVDQPVMSRLREPDTPSWIWKRSSRRKTPVSTLPSLW